MNSWEIPSIALPVNTDYVLVLTEVVCWNWEGLGNFLIFLFLASVCSCPIFLVASWHLLFFSFHAFFPQTHSALNYNHSTNIVAFSFGETTFRFQSHRLKQGQQIR